MATELVCLDSSVLIEYLRKVKKERSFFHQLSLDYSDFAVSIITVFEVYSGSTPEQKPFWDDVFQNFVILPFDEKANNEALDIFKKLRKKNKMIDMPDLFIGATALANSLKLATLNQKHFSRIEGLELVTR